MIKCEVTQEFTLEKFNELKNIQRKTSKNEKGKLFIGDIIECSKEMADYLLGENRLKRAFVKILEVVPEIKDVDKAIEDIKESAKEEVKKEKKTNKKKKKIK